MSEEEAKHLEERARECRTIAAGTTDERTRMALLEMAAGFVERAQKVRKKKRS